VVAVAEAGFTAVGLADGDALGLNKRGNLNLNLWGVGDATGVGVGLGDNSAVVCLRTRFGFGEGLGNSAGKADVALSDGGVAFVLSCAWCFGGETDSGGVPVSNCA
jgi:hypothetical protein